MRNLTLVWTLVDEHLRREGAYYVLQEHEKVKQRHLNPQYSPVHCAGISVLNEYHHYFLLAII